MGSLDDLAFSLSAVAARLREAGDEGLLHALGASIRKATGDVPEKIRDGMPVRMPRRYAEVLAADIKIEQRTFLARDEAVVSIYARNGGHSKRKLRQKEAGILWHPLWGNRKDWKEQAIKPGFFAEPIKDTAPEIRAAIDEALTEVAQEAMGKGIL